ncbi:hypothetical protein CCP3SC1AL1_350020 [Gammaproteobacteria bacterium]
MEAKNEKRNQRLFALLCIIVLSIMFAQGQVQRLDDYDNGKLYVCKVPKNPLSFNFSNTKDTLYLTIIADSIQKDVYSIMLYTYYTEKMAVPDKGLKIWFPDGSFESFEAYEVNKKERYIKYNIVGNSFEKMHKKEIEAIEFKEVALCESIGKKRYFIDFLNSYDK